MAGGWYKDGAVQEQIDASVKDAVERARARMGTGDSLHECEDCGETIPEARRKAVFGVRRCTACQQADEAEYARATAVDRRGSKDSQLK